MICQFKIQKKLSKLASETLLFNNSNLWFNKHKVYRTGSRFDKDLSSIGAVSLCVYQRSTMSSLKFQITVRSGQGFLLFDTVWLALGSILAETKWDNLSAQVLISLAPIVDSLMGAIHFYPVEEHSKKYFYTFMQKQIDKRENLSGLLTTPPPYSQRKVSFHIVHNQSQKQTPYKCSILRIMWR